MKGTYSLSDTHIFLPAAGLASGTVVSAEDGVFKYGHYWSSTFGKGLISDANKFVFHRRVIVPVGTAGREAGLPIRPVTE